MRFKNLLPALLLSFSALGACSAHAAVKDYGVPCRLAIIQDGQLIHESRRQIYGFSVEIISDSEGVKEETNRGGKPFVTALEGENYSVRLTNPLPVEAAVNLTVDGLNSISGKPSGISDGEKWILEPNSSVTIPGWQVNGATARRFFFTRKPKSYAQWRGDSLGQDLSANCGVIGAAFFWSQADLDRYFDENPSTRYSQRPLSFYNLPNRSCDSASMNSLAQGAPARAPEKDMKKEDRDEPQAGTGMGDSQSHPTYQVNFDYDRGMYQVSQAVLIYYDFAKTQEPNPFPEADYAPEM